MQSGGVTRRRIALEEQLALYSLFHRDPINRAIHVLTMPVILFSGLTLLAPIRFEISGGRAGLGVGLAFVLLVIAAQARLDRAFALATAAWILPLAWLSERVASSVPLVGLLAVNAGVQGIAWYLAVKIGHERFEERLLASTNGEDPALVSSNVYFDRGYFLLRNIGRDASPVESFQQFNISPFATTLDLMFSLGYRPDLRARIEALREECLARVARGHHVLPAEASATPPVAGSPPAVRGACASLSYAATRVERRGARALPLDDHR